ncbi:MAG: hypothetical protein IJZ89_03140 [Clostridia bacterium]|nr:hypothetical protein [Clostridia bacterium]
MFITKTLACPKLDASDCLKIISITNNDIHTPMLDNLREIVKLDDFEISDDELLAHMCIHEGIFTYRDWQELINSRITQVYSIDYEVDSTKRRLSLEETVYQMGGSSGRVSVGGYKMISALSARELVFKNIEVFSKVFDKEPREFIEVIWNELDDLLNAGIILGSYTHELFDLKYHSV